MATHCTAISQNEKQTPAFNDNLCAARINTRRTKCAHLNSLLQTSWNLSTMSWTRHIREEFYGVAFVLPRATEPISSFQLITHFVERSIFKGYDNFRQCACGAIMNRVLINRGRVRSSRKYIEIRTPVSLSTVTNQRVQKGHG